MRNCKNCKAKLEGKFCSQCGEKVIGKNELTITHIVSEAIGIITNFDSKLFRTIKLLFFYPGRLSKNYIEGIRVPFMKPFQIFVIANIIFFLFLSDIDLFRTPSKWFFKEDFDGIKVLEKVRQIAALKSITQEEIAVLYDQKSESYAKGLIFVLIPFIAFIGVVLNFRKKLKFPEHLVFATHYFSFVLIVSVINSELLKLFIDGFSKWWFIIPITIAELVYYIVGLNKFYKNSWVASVFKGVISVFLVNLFIQFYRVGINLLALNSI